MTDVCAGLVFTSRVKAMGIPLGQKIKAEKNGDTVLIRGSPVGRGDYDL